MRVHRQGLPGGLQGLLVGHGQRLHQDQRLMPGKRQGHMLTEARLRTPASPEARAAAHARGSSRPSRWPARASRRPRAMRACSAACAPRHASVPTQVLRRERPLMPGQASPGLPGRLQELRSCQAFRADCRSFSKARCRGACSAASSPRHVSIASSAACSPRHATVHTQVLR